MQKYVDDLYQYAHTQGEQMGYWPKAHLVAKGIYDYLPMCEGKDYKIEKLNFIGITHNQMGLVQDAMKYFHEALTLVLQDYSEDHEYYAKTIANFGISAGFMAYVREAIAYLKIALRIYQKHYGSEHYNSAVFYDYIGFCFEMLRMFDNAKESHHHALAIRKAEGHNFAIAKSLNNLGTVAIGEKDYQKAKELFTEALNLKEAIYHEEHPEIAVTINNLGVLLLRSGDAKAAKPYFEKALAIRVKALGRHHPAYMRTSELMAEMYYELKDYNQAMMRAELTRKFREHFYAVGHPETAKTYQILCKIHQALGNPEQAEYYQQLQQKNSLQKFSELNFPILKDFNNLVGDSNRW